MSSVERLLNSPEELERLADNTFVAFALLDELTFDYERLLKDIKYDWDIDIKASDIGEDENGDIELLTDLEGSLVAISVVPHPLPRKVIHNQIAANPLWPEAESIVLDHKGYVLVYVSCKDGDLINSASLSVKLSTSVLKQKHVIGVGNVSCVYSPANYLDTANAFLDEGLFPTSLIVYIGVYTDDEDEGRVNAYTSGLDRFGKLEIEIIGTKRNPEALYHFLTDVASYVILGDVNFEDGETVGFSDDQKLPIAISPGVALKADTVKIGY